jgi:DNA-binding transcriptional LysR family regulator
MSGTIKAMDLDANDLLLFARVAESGSFSRAAERVQLPKSTVSRRVAALERRLGERLLQRSTRKLAITDFGMGVLDHARALAAEVDGAQALAQHRQARPSGRLRVSMPADFASFALPTMLAAFAEQHPAIQLELDLSPRRVDLIGENFDLAVRMGELQDDSQLSARRLAEMTTGLYAAPAYLEAAGAPATPDDLLERHGLVLLKRSGDAQTWRLHSGPAEDRRTWQGTPVHRTLANSPDILMNMALAGFGVVALPDFYARLRVGGGALVRVLPGWCLPPGDCWAVFPERRLMPARTRVFLDALVATMGTCTEPSIRV